MGEGKLNNKKIAKNTIMLYCRMFVMMAISFYTSRVVLNALGVIDYGIYNVVGGIVGTLSVLNSAMSASTQRWITFALGKGDDAFLRKVFGVSVTSQTLLAIVVFLLVESIGLFYLYHYAVIPQSRLDTSFWVFQISVITMVINIVNVPFQGVIIAHEKMGIYAFFSIVDVVMKLVICYVLYVTPFDRLLIYSLLLFIAYVINFVCQQVYCRCHFEEAKTTFGWDWKLYKQMWSLAFWTLFGCVSYVSYSQGIVLLVNSFFGPAMNAACGIATQASNIINQFSSNFQVAVNPQITKTYSSGNYTDMNKLVFRSCKFSAFLILFLSAPVFYEADFLLQLWLGNVPAHAANFLRIGLLATVLNAVRNPLVTAALANGNLRKYQLVVNTILMAIFPLVYFCFMLFDIPELSTVIYCLVMAVATIASAFMLRRMTSLPFRDFLRQVMLKVAIVYLLSFAVLSIPFVLMDDGWLRLMTESAFTLLVCGTFVYTIGLNVAERDFAKCQMHKIMQRMNLIKQK